MFAKNIVVKMHVFLLIFCVSFYQPAAFAFSGDPLLFDKISNFSKNSSGFIADYFFKDYAGTTYSAKGHVVSNSQLAQVAKKRILCVTPVSGLVCAAMFAYGAAEVADYLERDGWIIDKEAGKIYKEEPSVDEKYIIDLVISPALVPQNSKNAACYDGGSKYAQHQNRNFMSSELYGSPERCRVKTTSVGGSVVREQTFAIIVAEITTVDQREITDTEMEAAISAQTTNTLAALATSPDYVKESHAPTAAAAAAAKPEAGACPAGTVKDPIRGTCLGSDKETKPKPDGVTELPEFCAYAQALCEWLNWTKQEPTLTPVPEIPKREISRDELPQAQQINFGGGCPSGETFQAFGQTVTLSYDVACDLMRMIKPFVILAGNVTALFIFINSIRN